MCGWFVIMVHISFDWISTTSLPLHASKAPLPFSRLAESWCFYSSLTDIFACQEPALKAVESHERKQYGQQDPHQTDTARKQDSSCVSSQVIYLFFLKSCIVWLSFCFSSATYAWSALFWHLPKQLPTGSNERQTTSRQITILSCNGVDRALWLRSERSYHFPSI